MLILADFLLEFFEIPKRVDSQEVGRYQSLMNSLTLKVEADQLVEVAVVHMWDGVFFVDFIPITLQDPIQHVDHATSYEIAVPRQRGLS